MFAETVAGLYSGWLDRAGMQTLMKTVLKRPQLRRVALLIETFHSYGREFPVDGKVQEIAAIGQQPSR